MPRLNVHGVDAFRQSVSALGGVLLREDLTLVTAVGRALTSPPAVLPRAQSVLDGAGIAVHGQIVEPSRVAFLVDGARAKDAVRVLHEALIESRQELTADEDDGHDEATNDVAGE